MFTPRSGASPVTPPSTNILAPSRDAGPHEPRADPNPISIEL